MDDDRQADVRVLHVDDEPDFADLTATFLEREREAFSVVTETDTADALARVEDESIDCVVSDFDMPGMDGLAFLEAVRGVDADLPFILFTGKGSEEIASDAITAGVTDYLQKETGSEQYAVLANRVANAVDQHRAERLRERYRTFLEHSSDVVTVLAADGTILYESPAVERVLGYDPDDLVGEQAFDYIHPDDRDDALGTFTRAITADDDVTDSAVYRFRHVDGSWRWLESVGTNRAVDEVDRFVINSRDVTERREKERRLRETERRFESVFSDPTSFIGLLEPDGTVERINPAALEFIDATNDDVVGEPFPETPWWQSGDATAAIRDAIDRAADGEFVRFEADNHDAGGDPIALDVTVRPVADDGEVVGLIAEGRDIDARKRRERELRDSRTKIAALHQVATSLEVAETAEEVCERTVAAAERVLAFDDCVVDLEVDGYLRTVATSEALPPDSPETMSVEEGLVGKTYRTGDSYRVDDLLGDEAANPQGAYESAISVPIGDHGVFQAASAETESFADSDLELAELLVSHAAAALTRIDRERELRERERALERQNDRLEAFAGVVSHDLRSPLNAASGRVELARDEFESEHLDAADRLLDRMDVLIEDVLTLARRGETVVTREPVALDRVVEQAWSTTADARASLEVADDPGVVVGDADRLRRLFENLFGNCVTHAGPAVTVEVGRNETGFYVADDGDGIPPDRRDVVFEWGHSSADGGTGFGLAIVADIVDAHGWDVRLAADSEGARFEVTGVEWAEG